MITEAPHRATALMLVAVLAALPLGWIPVAALGGFDLTLPYAMTLLLGLVLLARFGDTLITLRDLSGLIAPWLVVYLFYLVLLAISVAGLPSNGIVVRQMFFLTCGLTVACALSLLGANARALRLGGALAILGFLLVTEVYARQIGLGWITALQRFFGSGDLDFVIYRFLREIFRTAQGGDPEVAASVKNAVAAGLFTALLLFRAGHDRPTADRRGQVLTGVGLVVLLMLNTRSVLLMVVVALPLAALIATVRQPQFSARGLLVAALLALAGLATVILALSSETAALSVFEDRFAFGDNSVGGRFRQIEMALSGIEQNILFGSGLREIDGQLVHNLFLGAWLHGGLLAFLLVLGAYGALVVIWSRFLLEILTQPGSWVLPLRAEWIAVLPMMPLFRVWISGDAGHPEFSSWISLFAFCAILQVNRRARSAVFSPAPSGRAVPA